ncbi:Hypothetical predicted protein [Pelobates cultripes]|uniref:Uncharacterized protein n=1 Tax=Pelobates cultripes TaxID=61616 RepID=A0AAD1WEU9_PELCU|nr:Hypothetical predicted protein [Pelobates cultripes]
MDEFLSTPQNLRGARGVDKMVPTSPGSSSLAGSSRDSPRGDAMTQMSADLAAISANMLTRGDKTELVAELHSVIHEEIAAVRRDLSVLEQRVDDLQERHVQTAQQQQATDLTTTRQGNILLDHRRQVEDLNNRGQRNNIHIRGLPETDNVSPWELLRGLFAHILFPASSRPWAYCTSTYRTGFWSAHRPAPTGPIQLWIT